ncbi:MAG: 16S rRNA (uracil(1498)-N(3))-methyltransferase, partial [Mycobacteriales bacterium]
MGRPLSEAVFLVDDLPPGDIAVLDGDEGRHAARVRRLRVGDAIDISDGRGGRAHCTVRAVRTDVVELDIGARTYDPAPMPRLVVVQALAKGDRGERAVELMTELGVDEIVPWSASRSMVTWRGERGTKSLQRWRATARAATKQSRRSWLPEVSALSDTASVVERVRAATAAIVLHEGASGLLSAAALPADGDVLLVVGPEGGISDEEAAAFETAGAPSCRLGAQVLR